jgi:hypothetical protein
MFYLYPVEQGCWWLPALRRGQICFGSAAYRGKDFVTLLDETIKQIQRDAFVVVERQPRLILRAPVSLVLASPGAELALAKPIEL